MLGLKPIPSASEPYSPTHCAMGNIEISDNSSEITKNRWNDRDSNPDLLLENFLSQQSLTAETIYSDRKKIWQKDTEKKRKRHY